MNNFRFIGWKEYIKDSVCIYCGMPAECREHAAPYAWRHTDRLVNRIFVPACKECNAILGCSLQSTLKERIVEAKRRLKVRHKTELAIPHWTLEELLELGPSLRQVVLAGQHLQLRLIARLNFAYFEWVGRGRPEWELPK